MLEWVKVLRRLLLCNPQTLKRGEVLPPVAGWLASGTLNCCCKVQNMVGLGRGFVHGAAIVICWVDCDCDRGALSLLTGPNAGGRRTRHAKRPPRRSFPSSWRRLSSRMRGPRRRGRLAARAELRTAKELQALRVTSGPRYICTASTAGAQAVLRVGHGCSYGELLGVGRETPGERSTLTRWSQSWTARGTIVLLRDADEE